MGTSFSNKYQDVTRNKDIANVADNTGEEKSNNKGIIPSGGSTIEKNAELVKEKFGLDDQGMFCKTTKRTQVYASKNPIEDSIEFYEKIGTGGLRKELDNGKGSLTILDDNTYITHRIITKTPDSPAVSINVQSDSPIKTQKIHFIFEGGDT